MIRFAFLAAVGLAAAAPASAATTLTFDSLATGYQASVIESGYRLTLSYPGGVLCTADCLAATTVSGSTNGFAGGQVLQNGPSYGIITVSRVDGTAFTFESLGISGSGSDSNSNIDVNFNFVLADLGFTQQAQATIDVAAYSSLYSKVTPANLFSGSIDLTGVALNAFTIQAAPGASFGGIQIDNLVLSSVVAAPVPEPATWAMMVGGFGLVGGAMRRRQRTTVRFA